MTESPTAVEVIEAAEATLSSARLIELCSMMVDIASPTGEEADLAQALANEMTNIGLAGRVQTVNGAMANAHGRLDGTGNRPSLLLYAPIDTVTSGVAAEDLPWAGPELRPDMMPSARVDNGVVIGLGAQNPKGHGACVLAAAEALAATGVTLDGDLLLGFGGGGMPTNRRRPDLPDGHGAGCAALVEMLQPDCAVIAKTGWAISWEEVGLMWFEVEVGGSHTYVGSRHLLPYRNAIADAGHIVAGLERWFPQWAEDHRDGLVAPQGVVAAINGGWPNMAAFTTALCRFQVDLRLSPRTTQAEAAAAFSAELERLAGRDRGRRILADDGGYRWHHNRSGRRGHHTIDRLLGASQRTGAPPDRGAFRCYRRQHPARPRIADSAGRVAQTRSGPTSGTRHRLPTRHERG